MAVKRLLPAISHLHRPPGAQREHAGVDLHAHILAGAEGAAHSREMKGHFRSREVEAGGELLEIGVQPLRRDEEVDTAVRGRYGETRLRAEWSLVLHAGFVHPFDPDVGVRVGITMDDG